MLDCQPINYFLFNSISTQKAVDVVMSSEKLFDTIMTEVKEQADCLKKKIDEIIDNFSKEIKPSIFDFGLK
jgi:hypothetical protein